MIFHISKLRFWKIYQVSTALKPDVRSYFILFHFFFSYVFFFSPRIRSGWEVEKITVWNEINWKRLELFVTVTLVEHWITSELATPPTQNKETKCVGNAWKPIICNSNSIYLFSFFFFLSFYLDVDSFLIHDLGSDWGNQLCDFYLISVKTFLQNRIKTWRLF